MISSDTTVVDVIVTFLLPPYRVTVVNLFVVLVSPLLAVLAARLISRLLLTSAV